MHYHSEAYAIANDDHPNVPDSHNKYQYIFCVRDIESENCNINLSISLMMYV